MEPYRQAWISRDIPSRISCGWGTAMPDQRLLALARECRERAEEILARAETFKDAGAREGMRRIASGYEQLAERLEIQAGRPG
jgi:hypothetical protein